MIIKKKNMQIIYPSRILKQIICEMRIPFKIIRYYTRNSACRPTDSDSALSGPVGKIFLAMEGYIAAQLA